ncbi:hypothetical protein D3C87_1804610 [compost metagenome]
MKAAQASRVPTLIVGNFFSLLDCDLTNFNSATAKLAIPIVVLANAVTSNLEGSTLSEPLKSRFFKFSGFPLSKFQKEIESWLKLSELMFTHSS